MIDFYSASMANVSDIVHRRTWNIYSWLIDEFNFQNTTASVWIMLGGVLLCMIIPYLIGSINPAIIISKSVFDDDIRTHGSGNAGATNSLRTYGKKAAIWIFCLDMLKAAIAIGIGSLILTREMGGAIAGLFVIIGHMFPIYYNFKGGKGVSCLASVALILSPISFMILILLFVAIVLMTGFVSLGSIMVVMLYPLVNQAFYPTNGWITLTGVFIMILVVFMHRANIKRLLEGKESKINLKKKKRKNKDTDKDNQDDK